MFVYLCSFILLSCGQEPGRIFFLAQGAAQLRQRNILQLTNSLARYPKILADVFQCLRFSTAETETLRDDSFLALIEDIKKSIHLTEQILVAQRFKRRFRVLVRSSR